MGFLKGTDLFPRRGETLVLVESTEAQASLLEKEKLLQNDTGQGATSSLDNSRECSALASRSFH